MGETSSRWEWERLLAIWILETFVEANISLESLWFTLEGIEISGSKQAWSKVFVLHTYQKKTKELNCWCLKTYWWLALQKENVRILETPNDLEVKSLEIRNRKS